MSELNIDLSSLELNGLHALIRDAKDELSRREYETRRKIIDQAKELAASVGMTVEELAELASSRRKSKGEPKFQNPDNPGQTWSGRGKRPAWIREGLESGKTLDDFAVAA